MTRTELSTIVQAHACIIEGITYRFAVRGIVPEQLEELTFARALLHLDVTGGDRPTSAPVARLSLMAPLRQPAHIPFLLTHALRECLHTSALDAPSSSRAGRHDQSLKREGHSDLRRSGSNDGH